METQKDLIDIEVGTKEQQKIEPARVKIVEVFKKEVGEKRNTKIVCRIKHPAKDELLEVSSVKIENKGQLQIVGLWLNLDDDGLIQKWSALAKFLNFMKTPTLRALKDKEVDTLIDERGYLCFKAY